MPRARHVPAIDAPQPQQGDRQALVEAQQQAPLPEATAGNVVTPEMLGEQVATGQGLPRNPRRLLDPTSRPNEPITSGIPSGPGANSVTRRPMLSSKFGDLAYRTDDPLMLEIAISMQRMGL